MGRLLQLKDLDLDARWYFDDAYMTSNSREYLYEWPSKNFPYQHHIHNDDFSNSLRIEIRKWIEQHTDIVIVDTIDKDYRKYYGNYTYQYHDVRNWWSRFHFDNEGSSAMFKIAFSEWIKPVTNWHPRYPEDEGKMQPLQDNLPK